MRVDGRVGAAPRGAGQRDRADALALAAHEQLGAGGYQCGVATPDAEDEARGEGVAQHAEHGRRIVVARRVHLDLAREHDLLQIARADRLGGAGDRRLEMLGRHAARDLKATRGGGIEQRQRRVRELLQATAREPPSSSSAVSSGWARAASVRRTRRSPSWLLARKRHLGNDQRGRLEAAPRRRAATVGSEGKATDGDGATASLLARRVGHRLRRERAPAVGDRDKTIGTGVLDADRPRPSPASAAPPRSGCSKTNHGSPARREAQTTADGSTSPESAQVIVASVGRPERRARCSARSSRAPRRSRSASLSVNGDRSPVRSVTDSSFHDCRSFEMTCTAHTPSLGMLADWRSVFDLYSVRLRTRPPLGKPIGDRRDHPSRPSQSMSIPASRSHESRRPARRASRSPPYPALWLSRPCASSRSGRTGAPCSRTPRPSRSCP